MKRVKKEKKKGDKKKILRLSLSSIILIILLIGILVFILIYVTKPISREKPIFLEGKYNASPRNVEAYKKELEEGYPYFSAIDNVTWFKYSPFNWSEKELIELKIPNRGFEEDKNKDGWPDKWFILGPASYSDKNCFKGKRCLYVEADDSPYGYLILNSEPIDVHELYNYTVSFNINCIECNNKSAYMVIIWLVNKSFVGQPHLFTEGARHILYLHNTDGYEQFTISVQARSWAQKSIFGLRIHTESATIQPRTRLYIDS